MYIRAGERVTAAFLLRIEERYFGALSTLSLFPNVSGTGPPCSNLQVKTIMHVFNRTGKRISAALLHYFERREFRVFRTNSIVNDLFSSRVSCTNLQVVKTCFYSIFVNI